MGVGERSVVTVTAYRHLDKHAVGDAEAVGDGRGVVDGEFHHLGIDAENGVVLPIGDGVGDVDGFLPVGCCQQSYQHGYCQYGEKVFEKLLGIHTVYILFQCYKNWKVSFCRRQQNDGQDG